MDRLHCDLLNVWSGWRTGSGRHNATSNRSYSLWSLDGLLVGSLFGSGGYITVYRLGKFRKCVNLILIYTSICGSFSAAIRLRRYYNELCLWIIYGIPSKLTELLTCLGTFDVYRRLPFRNDDRASNRDRLGGRTFCVFLGLDINNGRCYSDMCFCSI